jgi:hypothetical protein
MKKKRIENWKKKKKKKGKYLTKKILWMKPKNGFNNLQDLLKIQIYH